MKNSIIIVIISSLFFSSCKEKCRDGDELNFGYLPQMESYFGMYKQGNWWVYKNQDSTKTDSIFITDFIEQTERDKTECISFPERRFKLHSQFLVNGMPILNGLYYNSRNCCINQFECVFSAQLNSNYDTYPKSPYSGIPEMFFNDLPLNSIIYHNVIFFKSPFNLYSDTCKTYIAPNIGMIKYINGTDTFSLKTYHIQ